MNAEYSPHQHPLFFRGGGGRGVGYLNMYAGYMRWLVGWIWKWKGNGREMRIGMRIGM